jgi:hypothetical protein
MRRYLAILVRALDTANHEDAESHAVAWCFAIVILRVRGCAWLMHCRGRGRALRSEEG